MWRVIWFFLGVSRLSITGASPEWCMQRLAKARVAFHFGAKPDEFTAEVWVLRRDEARAAQLIRMGGCDCEVLEHGGFAAVFGGLGKRPVLLILLAAAIAAAIVVPKFVFFYAVEGNETVPSAQILRELRELGVGFGTYGPSIKPQELKNQMLLRIPKLQWLTVQQSGMCARVVVRERPDKEPVLDRKAPTDVIASCAGVLTRVEAVAGNCLCAPGQAVAGGELLVSAYTDFGFKTQVTAARAEIYAETVRQAVCVLPETKTVKDGRTAARCAVSLLVGRRRISLFGAAMPERACEKETKIRYLTLPGGFSLPLGIAITRICEYDTREETLRAQNAEKQLLEQVQADAKRDMIAGTVRDCSVRTEQSGGCIRLYASLRCEEMIARMRPASLKEAIE